jgi:predicted  nucleic acid-binding Zn-ribbon protein
MTDKTKSNIFMTISLLLLVILFLSWTYFHFTMTVRDSAFETLQLHRNEIRQLNNQMTTMSMQMSELQSSYKSLNEKVESYNILRVRDHEYAMTQITRQTPRNIR